MLSRISRRRWNGSVRRKRKRGDVGIAPYNRTDVGADAYIRPYPCDIITRRNHTLSQYESEIKRRRTFAIMLP